MTARLVALGIGIAYSVGATLQLEPMVAWRYVAASIIAVSLIWFPEQLGAVKGMGAGRGHLGVDKETPGCMVAFFGWLMLAAIPVVHFGT